jgi:DNA-directed RNA polymerase subunit M/transcription elongation factor TFIIS
MNCINCKEETGNPKFCSRRCAAIYNNKYVHKIALVKRFCRRCGKLIERNSYKDNSVLCENCRSREYQFDDNVSLKDVIYTKHHKSSAFALVRSRARRVAEILGMNKCFVCGYDKHVEISHKKPISSFSEDTLVKVINSPDNLIALCRNHHWEFDHSEITVE